MPAKTPKADYDSPWKEILEQYFPQFMAFFFPLAFAQIDWSKDYSFLDKELQQVVREAETGSRRVDKLVKVYLLNGAEAWVLIHIEVQGQKEDAFPQRIYIYNYRLFDRYLRPIAPALAGAILTDDQPDWRPDQYRYELFGSRAGLDFPIVKLLDYKDKWNELEANPNPFAVVVMAHLQTQATRRSHSKRYAAKLNLAKMLYRRGYHRQDILNLFRFIDWIMVLPPELNDQFKTDVEQFETEVKMQYVTTIERIAIQEAKRENSSAFIVAALEVRFGIVPETVRNMIEQIEELEILEKLHLQAITADSLADFEQFLAAIT